MKYVFFILLSTLTWFCTQNESNLKKSTQKNMKQVELKNEKIKNHQFLPCMYQDSYFPEFLVDKVKAVLIELCANIETENPSDLDQLYNLSHAAIGKINNLEDDFFENNSEIETAAANCIASDFEFIAESYGFKADVESLIETRNW